MKMPLMMIAGLMLTGAAAAAPSPQVDARQHLQSQRIAQGVHNGSLTRREARNLRAQQRIIARSERVFEADGRLGRREAATLHQMQNGTSRAIYRQKHDRQRRW